MPDRYGFDHLPDRGVITHRCIEEGCGWPHDPRPVSEKERDRHAREHVRNRDRDFERRRRANAREALRLQRLAARENELVAERVGR